MARNKKSEFVSSFHIAARVFEKLSNAILDAGGSDEDVRRIETEDGLCGKLALVVMEGKGPALTVFQVTVDYSRSLEEMVKAGNHDYVNLDINAENFPVSGEGIVKTEVILVHFNRVMTDSEVDEEFVRLKLCHGSIEHLLALVEAQPELQRQFPIPAFGSAMQRGGGSRLVPCLGGRSLSLSRREDQWRGLCRFLAVRES